MQRRLQPLVTSQKISRGVYSFLPAGFGFPDECRSWPGPPADAVFSSAGVVCTRWGDCALPLPCIISLSSPRARCPILSPALAKGWEPISARLSYLNDRISMTQGAVSGITRACDVCHWRTKPQVFNFRRHELATAQRPRRRPAERTIDDFRASIGDVRPRARGSVLGV